jgi:hypothetical protein
MEANKLRRRGAYLAGLALALGAHAAAPAERAVGTDWVWFTDYAYLHSEWTLNAQAGCELEVGVGMKVRGKPRGAIRRFSGHITLTAWGIGAVHVRAMSGMAPCVVRVEQGVSAPIGVYSDPSLLQGVIRDGVIVYDTVREKLRGPQHQLD